MSAKPLEGLRILIIEDEFLIAMDVEQICRENGADDALIFGAVAELGADPFGAVAFDAAIIDLMAGGTSTLEFARALLTRGLPFIFATGYSGREELFAEFPGVRVVGKPYAGDDLVRALADAIGETAGQRS